MSHGCEAMRLSFPARGRFRAAGLALAGAIALGSPAGVGRAADDAKDGACADAIVRRVQARYEGVRDLSARFEQKTERVALGSAAGDALTARGEVVFAKPGKMRWSYEEPEPSLVVSDGETLWIYDPQAAEAQRFPLGDGFLTAAGLQFLLGAGRLADEFDATARGCGEAEVGLLLAPKREAQYERIELRVDRETGVVRETTVVDLFGNRTTVVFSALRENTGPQSALFAFRPPEGVRVLDLPDAR